MSERENPTLGEPLIFSDGPSGVMMTHDQFAAHIEAAFRAGQEDMRAERDRLRAERDDARAEAMRMAHELTKARGSWRVGSKGDTQ
jgi:hypothetical protein